MFTDDIKFQNISLEEGLSQSVVECIAQDYIGFMWFGTQDGLNKYDGYKFTVYKNNPEDAESLTNNYIRCIYEDRNKNLWIGTQDGLSRYDREIDRFKNYCNDPNIEHSIKNNQVRTIYEDRSGNLWIGTYGGGLNIFNFENERFYSLTFDISDPSSISDDRVTAIYEDSEENLWIGTWGGGLNLLDRKRNKFNECILSKDSQEDINSRRICSIFEDSEKSLYVGTNNGLYIKKNDLKTFVRFLHDPLNNKSISNDFISFIYEDRSKNIWVGTKEGGLNLFNKKKYEFTAFKNKNNNSYSISNNSVMAICQDSSGIVWIGTFGGGVNKFNKHSKQILHYFNDVNNPNSLSSNKVYCFYEDSNNNLWIGTRDGGLNKFERKKNIFTQFRHDPNDKFSLSHDTVTSIAEDDNKYLWIGTSGGGLNKYDYISNKFYHFKNDPANENSISNDSIFSLAKGEEDLLWIGTAGGGLDKYLLNENKFIHYKNDESDPHSISSNRVRTIFVDGENIWIGTDNGGLNRFDTKSGKFIYFKNNKGDNKSLSGNDVFTIYKDTSGVLWIGTLNAGFNRFDAGRNSFRRYNEKDGLPNDSINGILEDNKGYLWISTNNGLSKFDPLSQSFRNYDVRDGFQSNEFNPWAYLKLSSGEFVFGGINGFNIFFPDDMKDNSFIPPVIISDFLIFNKPVTIKQNGSPLKRSVTLQKDITLSHKDSVFSFEIASLDFNVPSKNQYAYKMEGFDKEWIYSGTRRFATYTNLNPGEYIFHVKGSNNDHLWNEDGKALKINITPPFWKTWWFRTLGAAALSAVAGSIYQDKLNKIRKEKMAQEEFTKRLIDVQENDRKRIASELHDSIGHDLLITKNKLLLSVKKPDDAEFLLNNTNEVSDIITETLKNVREISYTLHPYQIERLGLAKAIQSIADRVTKSTNITFTVNVDQIDRLLSPNIEINIYRIIQECINNIVKHSKANEVIININKDPDELSILISDNGEGFSTEKVKVNPGKHGFGLSGIAERVKIFDGKFSIDSSPGNGTSISINVPLNSKTLF